MITYKPSVKPIKFDPAISERELHNLLEKSCDYLQIPYCLVTYNHLHNLEDFQTYFNNENHIYIDILSKDLKIADDPENNPIINFLNKNPTQITIYTLFHEIGHYWHKIKHCSHYDKYAKQYKPNYNTPKEHNKQRLEQIANKIAWILYNKLIPKEILNENN